MKKMYYLRTELESGFINSKVSDTPGLPLCVALVEIQNEGFGDSQTGSLTLSFTFKKIFDIIRLIEKLH